MTNWTVKIGFFFAMAIGGIGALGPTLDMEAVSIAAENESNDSLQILSARLFDGLLDSKSSDYEADSALFFVVRDPSDGSLWGYGKGYGYHYDAKDVLGPFWGFSFPDEGLFPVEIEDAKALGVPAEKYKAALQTLRQPVYLGKFSGPGKVIELSTMPWASFVEERLKKFDAILIEAVGNEKEFRQRFRQLAAKRREESNRDRRELNEKLEDIKEGFRKANEIQDLKDSIEDLKIEIMKREQTLRKAIEKESPNLKP